MDSVHFTVRRWNRVIYIHSFDTTISDYVHLMSGPVAMITIPEPAGDVPIELTQDPRSWARRLRCTSTPGDAPAAREYGEHAKTFAKIDTNAAQCELAQFRELFHQGSCTNNVTVA